MMVLSLCRQLCPEKIPMGIMQKIEDGADGEVFDLEDPSKVIKFSVHYDQFNGLFNSHFTNNIDSSIKYLIKYPNDLCARIHAYECMGTFERTFDQYNQKFILYYYIMEKLNRISDDEKKIFHSICSHEDNLIVKNYPMFKIKKMLEGLSRGLDFDFEKVIFFCERLQKSPIEHLDLHPRNIMKDNVGNFKLIDFDRIKIKFGENHG